MDFFCHLWVGKVLIDNDTFNKLGVLDSASGLCDNLDQVKVNVTSFDIGNVQHSLDC